MSGHIYGTHSYGRHIIFMVTIYGFIMHGLRQPYSQPDRYHHLYSCGNQCCGLPEHSNGDGDHKLTADCHCRPQYIYLYRLINNAYRNRWYYILMDSFYRLVVQHMLQHNS
jgi:hypothetical protein